MDVVTAVLLNDNSHPSRQPNRHRHPNPKVDVLTAVRYSLQHDVSAALATPPVEGLTRKKLGALKAWLHALHHWLPQQSDGGVHATGAGLLTYLLVLTYFTSTYLLTVLTDLRPRDRRGRAH